MRQVKEGKGEGSDVKREQEEGVPKREAGVVLKREAGGVRRREAGGALGTWGVVFYRQLAMESVLVTIITNYVV